MISHALIIREQQRQESLDEAACQQRVAHHYPPTRFGGHLPHRVGEGSQTDLMKTSCTRGCGRRKAGEALPPMNLGASSSAQPLHRSSPITRSRRVSASKVRTVSGDGQDGRDIRR